MNHFIVSRVSTYSFGKLRYVEGYSKSAIVPRVVIMWCAEPLDASSPAELNCHRVARKMCSTNVSGRSAAGIMTTARWNTNALTYVSTLQSHSTSPSRILFVSLFLAYVAPCRGRHRVAGQVVPDRKRTLKDARYIARRNQFFPDEAARREECCVDSEGKESEQLRSRLSYCAGTSVVLE